MIDLYTGTPRSGKSFHAAQRICLRSRFGEPVLANFPCDLSRYKKANFTFVPNNELTPEYLRKYSQDFFHGKSVKEGAILLVIDEAQLLFNSREWQHRYRQNWLSFFTLHGKLGYDIILISQMDRMIDRQIRGLVEYEYIHRRLANFGWRGFLLRLVTFGADFMSVKVWYPMNEKIDQEVLRLSKKVYSIYDTHLLFDADSTEKLQEVPQTTEISEPQEILSNAPNKAIILLRSFFAKIRELFKKPLRSSSPSGRFLKENVRTENGWLKKGIENG